MIMKLVVIETDKKKKKKKYTDRQIGRHTDRLVLTDIPTVH